MDVSPQAVRGIVVDPTSLSFALAEPAKSTEVLPLMLPILPVRLCREDGTAHVPFQDRGHGKSTDRITMTFFYAARRLSPPFSSGPERARRSLSRTPVDPPFSHTDRSSFSYTPDARGLHSPGALHLARSCTLLGARISDRKWCPNFACRFLRLVMPRHLDVCFREQSPGESDSCPLTITTDMAHVRFPRIAIDQRVLVLGRQTGK